MKDVKRVMDSVSNSLDDAIQKVTDSNLRDCQAAGLASLPDDVLAQIFETCYNHDFFFRKQTYKSLYSLASTCKRFRRIALRLPHLWKAVSLHFSKERLSAHTSRCRNLIVRIPRMNSIDEVSNFLRQIEPYHQWEELDVSYSNEDQGHRFSQLLGP